MLFGDGFDRVHRGLFVYFFRIVQIERVVQLNNLLLVDHVWRHLKSFAQVNRFLVIDIVLRARTKSHLVEYVRREGFRVVEAFVDYVDFRLVHFHVALDSYAYQLRVIDAVNRAS